MGDRQDLVILPSPLGFEDTRSHLRDALREAGATVFAVIDHAAAARSVGLSMPETVVIVFGNPRGGTELMRRHPDLALDMPYRLLVREEAGGGVSVVSLSAAAMEARHGLSPGEAQVFHHLEALLREIVSAMRSDARLSP